MDTDPAGPVALQKDFLFPPVHGDIFGRQGDGT